MHHKPCCAAGLQQHYMGQSQAASCFELPSSGLGQDYEVWRKATLKLESTLTKPTLKQLCIPCD